MRRFSGRTAGAVMGALAALVLTGCAQTAGAPSDASVAQVQAAQYTTPSGHYRVLQRAGLTGNYTEFAAHLNADAQEQIIAQLTRSFGGQPFDVYTWKTQESEAGHTRLVELRSQTGRLYLYVRLDRVPGGWRIASWELSRKRAVVTAKI